MSITPTNIRLTIFLAALSVMLMSVFTSTGHAQALNCSEQFQIIHTFDNGAAWEMCWEVRDKEAIVFHDIYYTTAHGLRRKVLAQMNLAQIHVPYDDGAPRYHDISDFGLATDQSNGQNRLQTMSASECPNGSVISDSTRNLLCLQEHDHGYARKSYIGTDVKKTITIRSVARVQRYYYTSQYEFHDDGTIEPSVAASGLLQEFMYSTSTTSREKQEKFGWEIYEIASGPVFGTNHTHNYWWKLDFDLGGAANDVLEEINFVPEVDAANPNGNYANRVLSITTYTEEVGRPVSAETMRSWRVKDTVLQNTDGHAISYDILPNGSNIYRGPSNEPWTVNNIYATNSKSCERFTSHNPTIDGCGSHVAEFTNGEVLTDTVVWYGVTFHHLVRDEDNDHMHAHEEGFTIAPRDWTKSSPLDMDQVANVAVTLSESTRADRPFANVNTNLFLLAASFVFVVGTVMARQVTRNR